MRKFDDVEFRVTGIINGVEESIDYKFKDGFGTVAGGKMSMFMLDFALKDESPIGPVGEYVDRDINNPLSMIFILNSKEVFEKVIKVEIVSGTMPEASPIPKDSIC